MSFVADFRPSDLVANLHDRVPRFGHSNSIARLASSVSGAEDYKDGIVAFCIFLSFFVFAWIAMLLAFKFYYKRERVGCAAGGEVVEIKQLKKVEGLNKFERKDRILRSWRVQTACLLACLAIVALSVLMLQFGLDAFLDSLQGIQQINDEVDSRAYRAIQIIAELQESNAALDKLKMNSSFVLKTLELKEFCPNFDPTLILNDDFNQVVGNNTDFDALEQRVDLNALLGFDPAAVRGTILSAIEQANAFKDYNMQQAVDTMYQVTDFTAAVDDSMDSLYSKDWIIRLWVVILDVVVGFLVVAIILTKHSIDYPAYQSMTQWVLLPIFCAALVATVVGTCVFVSMAIANADFCAGGEVQSPLGTLREMIEQHGYNETSLPAKALKYYGSDCLSENPLSFLDDIELGVGKTQAAITNLYSELNSEQLKTLIPACGNNSNIPATNKTFYSVGQHLNEIHGTLTVAMELVDCSNISPVFRLLLYGSPCNQSVVGLTWLWTTMLSMTIMGLVVLTLRAAFFNPVIRGRRTKRREQEFEDYKLYMSKFYDTSNWDIHMIPDFAEEKKVEQSCSETDSTSAVITPEASEEEEDGRSNPGLVPTIVSSHDGSVFLNLAIPIQHEVKDNTSEEAEDDEDSDYDSTYSCDSDDDIRSLSSNSVFSAIFQKRRQRDRDRLHAHDLSQIPSSNSSILGRFLPHRTRSMKSSADQSFLTISEQMNHSMLSTTSSNLRGASSSEDRYTKHENALYLNNGFFQESDSDDEDDDVDSLAGVLMTPPELRYQTKGRAKSSQKSRIRVQDDPEGFEMEPLSPSPQNQQTRRRRNSMEKDVEIV